MSVIIGKQKLSRMHSSQLFSLLILLCLSRCTPCINIIHACLLTFTKNSKSYCVSPHSFPPHLYLPHPHAMLALAIGRSNVFSFDPVKHTHTLDFTSKQSCPQRDSWWYMQAVECTLLYFHTTPVSSTTVIKFSDSASYYNISGRVPIQYNTSIYIVFYMDFLCRNSHVKQTWRSRMCPCLALFSYSIFCVSGQRETEEWSGERRQTMNDGWRRGKILVTLYSD